MIFLGTMWNNRKGIGIKCCLTLLTLKYKRRRKIINNNISRSNIGSRSAHNLRQASFIRSMWLLRPRRSRVAKVATLVGRSAKWGICRELSSRGFQASRLSRPRRFLWVNRRSTSQLSKMLLNKSFIKINFKNLRGMILTSTTNPALLNNWAPPISKRFLRFLTHMFLIRPQKTRATGNQY